MNPLEVIGWLVVGLLSLVVIAVLAAIIFLIISISLYLRDKRREIAAQEEEGKRRFDGAPVPYFPGMETGDVFKVDYQAWEITALETEQLPEHGYARLILAARSITD